MPMKMSSEFVLFRGNNVFTSEALQEQIQHFAIQIRDTSQQHRRRGFVPQWLGQGVMLGEPLDGRVRGNGPPVAPPQRQYGSAR